MHKHFEILTNSKTKIGDQDHSQNHIIQKIDLCRNVNNKNLDFIVLNSLKDRGAGFGVDTNKISIIDSSGKKDDFEVKPKSEVAKDIVNELIKRLSD